MMAIEIVSLTCQPGVYTLVADNKANMVGVSLRGQGSARFAASASQPSPSSVHFYTMIPDVAQRASLALGSVSGLESTDKFWVMPEGQTPVTVEVIRG